MAGWNMASEQRTEPGGRKLLRRVRLRQVPPVTADRVSDLKRSVPQRADEKKWYHGRRARLLLCKSMERTGFFWHIRKAFYTLLYIWPSGQNPVEIL